MSDSRLQNVVCCLGQPVVGNPTQFMMERAFAAAGLDWRYLTLEVSPARLGDGVRGIRALGFRGANVMIPHKMAVIEYLDSLTEIAQLIGAVTTVERKGDLLVGDNTEGKAFLAGLRPIVEPKERRCVVLGAGGTARAIAVELGLAGAAEITVVNRSAERGGDLASLLEQRVHVASHCVAWDGDYAVPPETDIIVHATSLGASDPEARVPVVDGSLESRMVVADVIPNPTNSRLLKTAAERGCRTVDGLEMLVHRGSIDFRAWTEVGPDPHVLRESIEEYLEI